MWLGGRVLLFSSHLYTIGKLDVSVGQINFCWLFQNADGRKVILVSWSGPTEIIVILSARM
jgi:hypothetical protein